MDFEEMIEYITEHLQEDIKLVDLGKMIGYSPWHTYKLFKTYTGEPLMAYIRKQRLIAAASQIQQEKNLLNIAVDYGFETAAGFYKAFYKHFNCSPSEYKRNCKIQKRSTSSDITEIIYENGVTEMARVIIRKLQKSDAKSLHENIYVKNTLEEVEKRVDESLEKMNSGENIQVVAVADNNIVGTLILQRENHPIYLHCGSLGDEVVNPAFDGMGIPNLLFEEVKRFGKEIGIKIIKGNTRANYFTERFFIENNFVEIGRIPGGLVESWNNNEVYDEILYYCSI